MQSGSYRAGWILAAISTLILAAASITTILQRPDASTAVGFRVYSGALAGLTLSVLLFVIVLVALRQERGWAVVGLSVPLVMYALPLFLATKRAVPSGDLQITFWLHAIAFALLTVALVIAALAIIAGKRQERCDHSYRDGRGPEIKGLGNREADFLMSYRADVEKAFHDRVSFFLVAESMIFAGFAALVSGKDVPQPFKWASATFGLIFSLLWALVTCRQRQSYEHIRCTLKDMWLPYKLIRETRPRPTFLHAMDVLVIIPFLFLAGWVTMMIVLGLAT